jgi:carotenoid cleavage dioxygenase-like enzyme
VNSLGRFDVIDRKQVNWFVGDHYVLQEPTFVPRPGSTAEGDGYLLATVHNLASQRTELAIVDAMAMRDVARLLLPFRAAAQVHGAWAGAGNLPIQPGTTLG